ncbi:MAG: electron transfer flavoprotein subunit beta/FixA family protein [Clostridiales bacterium]|jgi:electron transfer flavoprotein beta subunit|nr:electron transfer flavoprotein subunit beta/FixA family protein [Clostridiales bacterium]
MRIIVCVKQVPNTDEVKIDPVKGTLIREGVPSILNPDDANALEAALKIKDEFGARVTVLSMGPKQAAFALKECLAMGADDALLLCDRAFAGGDTWATSNTLAAAIKALGGADLILAGSQAIDGDTAQVGPQIAAKLDIPQITFAIELQLKDSKISAKRQTQTGYELIEAPLPALLTATRDLNVPRHMNAALLINATETEVPVWGLKDINISEDETGLKASPTRVIKSFVPPLKAKGKIVSDISAVIKELKAKRLIGGVSS